MNGAIALSLSFRRFPADPVDLCADRSPVPGLIFTLSLFYSFTHYLFTTPSHFPHIPYMRDSFRYTFRQTPHGGLLKCNF